MSFRVLDESNIPDSERVSNDRPDHTTEESAINVDVDLQATRVEGITFANSTDPIASGEEYNSGWQVAGEFVYIRGNVFSTASGMIYEEQSNDGETLHVQTTKAYTGGDYDGGFVEDIVSPYVRVRFVPTTAATSLTIRARLSME